MLLYSNSTKVIWYKNQICLDELSLDISRIEFDDSIKKELKKKTEKMISLYH